ncbi:MAG: HNH endonuclease [Victivallales bacterium]|nr:HNH endonuclease [Victivallales bacterium]
MGEDDSLEFGGYFIPADDEHVRIEKAKARELRKSQWWKNELGKGVCHYCGKRFSPHELTMDHIVPIIRGGFTRKGNVVTCCKECNNKKKYLLPVEWAEYLEKLRKDGSAQNP